MTLSITEFLRRFELHFLPKRFVKIRHYGFLQNHGRTTRLNAIRKQLQLQPLPPKVTYEGQKENLPGVGQQTITKSPH